MKKQIALSGIAQKAILDCYLAMKEYMHDENLEDEERFYEMYDTCEQQKSVIPNRIYSKIKNFINSTLAPIVFENDTVYAACYAEDICYQDENGHYVVKKEEDIKTLLLRYFSKTLEIEEKLDRFAADELYPYLVSHKEALN